MSMDQDDPPAAVSSNTSGVPHSIDVLCGEARGTYIVSKGRVVYEGQEISATEFEKIGGKSSSKKWRNSLRVQRPDGTGGPCVGDWLMKHGLDNTKPRQPRTLESKATAHSELSGLLQQPTVQQSQSTSSMPDAAARPWGFAQAGMMASQPGVSAQSAAAVANLGAAAPRPAVTSECRQAPARPAFPKPAGRPVAASRPAFLGPDLVGHLQRQYVGLIPGDPTVESLPEELPAAAALGEGPDGDSSDVTVIHVAELSHEALMEMSRASAADPLGQLLPEPPGILPEREAHLTGHRPVKRARVAGAGGAVEGLSKHEAAIMLGEYMAGSSEEAPWEALGLAKQPIIGGRPLDLREFYAVVQQHGGFDVATAKKRWGKVAKKLGVDLAAITNAGFVLRNNYSKLLLAYETQARAYAAAAPPPALSRGTPSASEPRSGATSTGQDRSAGTAAAGTSQQLQQDGGMGAEDAEAVSSAVLLDGTIPGGDPDRAMQPPDAPEGGNEELEDAGHGADRDQNAASAGVDAVDAAAECTAGVACSQQEQEPRSLPK